MIRAVNEGTDEMGVPLLHYDTVRQRPRWDARQMRQWRLVGKVAMAVVGLVLMVVVFRLYVLELYNDELVERTHLEETFGL